LEYASNLSLSENIKLKTVNMGGGFGIPYFAQEKELDLSVLGKGIKKIIETYKRKMPDTAFKIELGRYIVGESGVYLCRILYRKISHGKIFLITNGGMHHHLSASGNLGQSLVRRPMPLTIANKLNNPTEKVTVAGPLCTPLDTFGSVDMPCAEEGDLVVVFNSGAYGYTASPTMFLSHKTPVEVIL
jgi:diaminopimelate decarboxylase